MPATRVLIVDDHPAIAMSLRIMLEREGFEIAGEATNGMDAVKQAREYLPDVIILDIGIPMLDGLQVIERILASQSKTRIIVLTTETVNNYGYRCSQAGASGFVSKNEPLDEVINAVNAVISGRVYFPQEVFEEMRIGRNTSGNEVDLLDKLTNRELVILKMLAQGKSNKDIGETLLLSNKTISTYKTRILEKLKLNNIANLIDFSRRHHLS